MRPATPAICRRRETAGNHWESRPSGWSHEPARLPNRRWLGPTASVTVIPDEEEPRARERNRFDTGQATMQMMIAAADQGIGTGHSAVGDQALARAVLNVPRDKLVAFVIDLGYPADRPLRSGTRLKRRPFEEVVHRNR